MSYEATSYAVFGSLARGDQDYLSDQDILVVSGTDRSGHTWARQNFNNLEGVSVYTWRRLRAMSATKSLFVQHLKDEAIVELDPQGVLSELLATYLPATSYSHEIRHTNRFLQILEEVPFDLRGIGWAMDVLSVIARNVAIARLANEGDYIFSWPHIAASLVGKGIISQQEARIFLFLRTTKKMYRSGAPIRITEAFFRRVCAVVARICREDIEPVLVRREQLGVFETDKAFDAYSRSRLIERDLFSLTVEEGADGEEFGALFGALQGKVANPRAYLWAFGATKIEREMKALERLKQISRLG